MASDLPDPDLSDDEKQLIGILIDLLKRCNSCGPNEAGYIFIGAEEAARSELLLQRIMADKAFLEKMFFSQAVLNKETDIAARRLFLSRARIGMIKGSRQWEAFKHGVFGNKRMKFDEFVKREGLVFSASGIQEDVSRELIKDIVMRRRLIESRVSKERRGRISHLRDLLKPLLRQVSERDVLTKAVSQAKVKGCLVLLANLSVLFSTRDWGITGVISAAAAHVIDVVEPSP